MDGNCQCKIKLYVEKLVDRINSLGVLTEPSNGSPANNIHHFRGCSSDVTTRENENKITTFDDENEQSLQGTVNVESDDNKFKKDLDDLEEILNIVVDFIQSSMSESLPSEAINFLRSFTTSIRQKMENIIDTCKKTLTYQEKTVNTPRTNVGLKRVRDIDEWEHNTFKRPKTENKNNESSKITSISSFVESNTLAAKKSIENYLKTRKTFKPATTTETENSNIQARKFEFSRIVVNELNPYYKNNQFAAKDLFQFMAKSIVHKLLEYTIYPGDHTIKSTIRQMIYKTKIESKVQITNLLDQFF